MGFTGNTGIEDILCKLFEFFSFSNKIGFAVYHDNCCKGFISSGFCNNKSFVSIAVGSFTGDFLSFFPEIVDCFFKIAF